MTILFFIPSISQSNGAELFSIHCSGCHAPIEIQTNWSELSEDVFLNKISKTMPPDAAGSLGSNEYLEIKDYIFDLKYSDSLMKLEEYPITQSFKEVNKEMRSEISWKHFGGEMSAQRYSSIDQVNNKNVNDLEIAWRWKSKDFGNFQEIRNVSMPIMRNGLVFIGVGSTRSIAAIDAENGETVWIWHPNEGDRFSSAARKDSGKGVAYFEDGNEKKRVIVITPGYQLVSLDADTGIADENFGINGIVDLTVGMRTSSKQELDVGSTSPPLVIDDVIIVGSAHKASFAPASMANVKGDVRGYDAHTGNLLWTFKTIPSKGEYGYDTWLNGSAEYTGNASVWAPMSADQDLGLVYLPIESATGDRYGGDRPGDNLFSSSLVAVDAKTGKLRWHYQIVHHDIWDYDNSSAPILADLDDKKIVIQLTKQSYAFVFDRETGEPHWPIHEIIVPKSDVPGEWTSPTQPIPSLPEAYDRSGVSRNDLIDYTPEISQAVENLIKDYRLGPLYTPPSLAESKDGTKGTLSLPFPTGGSNWEGGAYDPETNLLYVPSQTRLALLSLKDGDESTDVRYVASNSPKLEVFDIPIAKPPWGRITAIDMNSGKIKWSVANGETPEAIINNPYLKGVEIPRTGKATRAGLLLTKTLLFAGEGFGGDPVFRAHDKYNGKIISEIVLPGSQSSPPSTYMINNRQFIIMTISDGKSPAELIALSLPGSRINGTR
ncbi:PQQ-binding-like beta-propeller repeat protein [Gammaproteobacteria bacterium]|nr:PQQ-binding-like beta-propeller repeat protein [Gammaproteobacteria bacterium]